MAKLPRFQLRNVYQNGDQDEPKLFAIHEADNRWVMNRRAFFATSAVGLGALAGCIGCGNRKGSAAADELPMSDLERRLRFNLDVRAHANEWHAHANAAFSPDGRYLVTGSASHDMPTTIDGRKSGNLKLWEFPSGRLVDTPAVLNYGGVAAQFARFQFTPDGSRLVNRLGYEVNVLNFPELDLYRRIECPDRCGGAGLSLSPDSRMLAWAAEGRVDVWDIETGEVVYVLEGNSDEWFADVAFDPRDEFLVSASGIGANLFLRIWDYRSQTTLSLLHGDRESFSAVDIDPSGQHIAAVSNQALTVWDRGGNQIARRPVAVRGSVYERFTSVKFSPDSKHIATCNPFTYYYTSSMLWRFPSLERVEGYLLSGVEEEMSTTNAHQRLVGSMDFSPDAKYLACGVKDGSVLIWDLQAERYLTCLFDEQAMEIDQELSYYEQADEHGRGVFYSVACGSEIPQSAACVCNCVAGPATVQPPYVAPPTTLPPIDINGLYEFNFEHIRAHAAAVTKVLFTPDGTRLISAGGPLVKMWEFPSGRLLDILEDHESAVEDLAISEDGAVLASVSCANRGGSAVVMVHLLENLSSLRIKTTGANRVALNSDGTALATNYAVNVRRAGGTIERYREVNIWPLQVQASRIQQDGQPERLLGHTQLINALAVHGDSDLLASCSGGDMYSNVANDFSIRIWRLADLQVMHTLEGHDGKVTALAFHPNGLILASGSDDRSIKLWDVETGDEMATISGHYNRVNALAFNADGSRLLSSAGENDLGFIHCTESLASPGNNPNAAPEDDNSFRVWDLSDRSERFAKVAHTRVVSSVAISPDGRYLVSGSWDNTIKVWDSDGNYVTSLFDPAALEEHLFVRHFQKRDTNGHLVRYSAPCENEVPQTATCMCNCVQGERKNPTPSCPPESGGGGGGGGGGGSICVCNSICTCVPISF